MRRELRSIFMPIECVLPTSDSVGLAACRDALRRDARRASLPVRAGGRLQCRQHMHARHDRCGRLFVSDQRLPSTGSRRIHTPATTLSLCENNTLIANGFRALSCQWTRYSLSFKTPERKMRIGRRFNGCGPLQPGDHRCRSSCGQ